MDNDRPLSSLSISSALSTGLPDGMDDIDYSVLWDHVPHSCSRQLPHDPAWGHLPASSGSSLEHLSGPCSCPTEERSPGRSSCLGAEGSSGQCSLVKIEGFWGSPSHFRAEEYSRSGSPVRISHTDLTGSSPASSLPSSPAASCSRRLASAPRPGKHASGLPTLFSSPQRSGPSCPESVAYNSEEFGKSWTQAVKEAEGLCAATAHTPWTGIQGGQKGFAQRRQTDQDKAQASSEERADLFDSGGYRVDCPWQRRHPLYRFFDGVKAVFRSIGHTLFGCWCTPTTVH